MRAPRSLALGVAFASCSLAFACDDIRVSLGEGVLEGGLPADATLDREDLDGGYLDGDGAPRRSCPHGAPFLTVKPVPGLESVDVWSARFSPDETTAYLSLPTTPGTASGFDLYTAGRISPDTPFGAPAKLSISSVTDDYWPTVSPDGKVMFFESGLRPDGSVSESRIWFASRATVPGNFSATILDYFASVPETVTEASPYLIAGGNKLYWASIGREGTSTLDIWGADVTSAGAIVTPFRLNVSTDNDDAYPVVTDDDAELFFGHDLKGSAADVYESVKEPGAIAFSASRLVAGPINTPDAEWSSWISPDACRLYFIRKKEGVDEARLLVAERAKP